MISKTQLDEKLVERFHNQEDPRTGDVRGAYGRDKARILHCSAFRRLQGKTQVMGAGEGDFHRTRLTHSIECAQIGAGILNVIRSKSEKSQNHCEIFKLLPSTNLVEASCYAHDIGHPPYGHAGEKALHQKIYNEGGFEGNGQTLRILTRLEKYKSKGLGLNPTRRLILAILKYPVSYNTFDEEKYKIEPPKCFYNDEKDIIDWATDIFPINDRDLFCETNDKGKAKYRSFDCSLMELADDIAYGIHDIEDIVARNIVDSSEVHKKLNEAFKKIDDELKHNEDIFTAESVFNELYETSFSRKQIISKLVNLFVVNSEISKRGVFECPLLEYCVTLPKEHQTLLNELKNLSFELVIERPQIQQLEKRGKRIISELFDAISEDPEHLIPKSSRDSMVGKDDSRSIADYIAGMTDGFAEKVYKRLFIPGFGSSVDEI